MTDEPVGFMARLKQHHIYRVVMVYAITAWILIQAGNAVFPDFGLPRSDVRAVIVVLLLLFPVVLVASWMLIKPKDPTKFSRWQKLRWKLGSVLSLVVLILVVISGGFVWRYSTHHPLKATAVQLANAPVSATSVPAAVAIPAKSIAVLPFENLSPDKNNAYFADGIQDMILTKLADVGDLKVIARTSTEKYGSHPADLRAIAQQLGVATILEGSVQKVGNQVLINVQLIDADTDAHLWANDYQRTLDNVFGVEGEVAQKVAQALDEKLTPAEAQRVAVIPTHNKAAYDADLRAIYYLDDSNRTLDRSELERSASLARQAIQLDPNFVDAYITLALDDQKLGGHDKEAEAATRRALALDPKNADAHRLLGFVLMDRGDLKAAIAEELEAVRLNPSAAYMPYDLGFVYMHAGRFDDATAADQRAIELAPQSNFLTEGLARIQMMQRRYAEARNTLQIPLARDPGDLRAPLMLARIQWLGWGDLDAARKLLQAIPTPVVSSSALSEMWYHQYMFARDYTAALGVLDQAQGAWFVSFHIPRELLEAQVYQAEGDAAKSHAAFATARTQLETWIKATPDNADLHANLALALAGLGQKSEALKEAQRAVALQPVAKDAVSGPGQLANLAAVDARIGDTAAAIKLLDQLLAMPAGFDATVPLLKLDPAWDPIRKDPRFQALLQKYTQYQPAVTNDTSPTAATTVHSKPI